MKTIEQIVDKLLESNLLDWIQYTIEPEGVCTIKAEIKDGCKEIQYGQLYNDVTDVCGLVRNACIENIEVSKTIYDGNYIIRPPKYKRVVSFETFVKTPILKQDIFPQVVKHEIDKIIQEESYKELLSLERELKEQLFKVSAQLKKIDSKQGMNMSSKAWEESHKNK